MTYLVLLAGDHGTLVGVRSEGVAKLEGLSLLGELAQELVVDPGLNVDTRAGRACLAVVEAI